MCGIIGVLLKTSDAPNVMEAGLEQLKYRGYDSAGAACSQPSGEIVVKKIIGPDTSAIRELPPSCAGIAHRRWATHGKPSLENQHPHLSEDNKIAVVHNGTIKNYQTLKENLEKQGTVFKTECDTEIIPNLINFLIKQGKNHKEAIRETAIRIEGKNSFIVLFAEGSELWAVQNGLPLVVGFGDSGAYIASDVRGFIKETSRGYQFDSGQFLHLVIQKAELFPEFYSLDSGTKIERRLMDFNIADILVDKGDFPHFMLKEIWEQKNTIKQTLEYNLPQLTNLREIFKSDPVIYFVGCGTAYKVAAFGAMLMNRAGKRSFAYPGSESKILNQLVRKNDIVVFISQSGTTGDLIGLDKDLKNKGIKTIGFINVEGSYLAESVDILMPLRAGVETAVASTKATTAQMILAYGLSAIASDNFETRLDELENSAGYLDQFLNDKFANFLSDLVKDILSYPSEEVFIMGRGLEVPVAKEAEIKMSEVGYVKARGFAAGEIKHGYIARIEKGFPCLILIDEETKEEVVNNALQCKSRGAMLIGLGPREFDDKAIFDKYIRVPNLGLLQPIVNLLPIQLLSYYIGLAKGNDIDYPRNLAKSVTVE